MWMEHALKAQKLTSNSKQQQLGAQKGTGETPSQVASMSTVNSMNAQKVAASSREGVLRKAPTSHSSPPVEDDNFDTNAHEEQAEEAEGEPAYEEYNES